MKICWENCPRSKPIYNFPEQRQRCSYFLLGGMKLATTRIIPLHVGKGRTESCAIADILDYAVNPEKTDGGRLISSYGCDSRVADAEFMLAKRQYVAATGRSRGRDDVLAYQVRQSFKPGEITPEEANRLGMEFARRFTKGNHAFVVCTHIDKSHIHNVRPDRAMRKAV